jgi:hypothetical protein
VELVEVRATGPNTYVKLKKKIDKWERKKKDGVRDNMTPKLSLNSQLNPKKQIQLSPQSTRHYLNNILSVPSPLRSS